MVSSSNRRTGLSGDVALDRVKSILFDVSINIAALIDAVCCCPHFASPADPDEGPISAISLALAADDRGLHARGFIDMRVLPRERTVEFNGGYFDEYHQPRPVIDGSLSWQEVTQQRLGQTLLLMYASIMQACPPHDHE